MDRDSTEEIQHYDNDRSIMTRITGYKAYTTRGMDSVLYLKSHNQKYRL